jgi:phosphoglycolate phosphatase-like HAD superfamily hydrolase
VTRIEAIAFDLDMTLVDSRPVSQRALERLVALGMLQAAGLHVDRLHPDAWGAKKVEPIRAERCWAFVGDHRDDMLAGRQAGAIAIGVNSGTSPPIGAQVELEDLAAFPSWLADRRLARRRQCRATA